MGVFVSFISNRKELELLSDQEKKKLIEKYNHNSEIMRIFNQTINQAEEVEDQATNDSVVIFVLNYLLKIFLFI